MKKTFLLLLIFTLAHSTFSFEIDDIVLASCGIDFSKAKVIEISDRGNKILKFENEKDQRVCGDNFYNEESRLNFLVHYRPVDSYDITREYRGGLMDFFKLKSEIIDTIRVGDLGSFKCGNTYTRGHIGDITEEGYFKFVFDDEVANIVCSDYNNINDDYDRKRLELF